jgi:hypothetical protein
MPREMAGNAPQSPSERLRTTGLRPTRQRVALAGVSFAGGDRRFTAGTLHAEAAGNAAPAGIRVENLPKPPDGMEIARIGSAP